MQGVTNTTEADATAERLTQYAVKVLTGDKPTTPAQKAFFKDVSNVAQSCLNLRTEAAWLAADLAAACAERDEARQAAADWRLLAECCALRGVMQFLTAMRHINEVSPGHDGLRFALSFLAADSYRGDLTRSLVAAARRLAAPHLNPPAEGGGK